MLERIRQMMERIREARRDDEAGFTLIELLIVIVILGVLAGIVVFSVQGIQDRGKTGACKADVATVQTAEEAYYAQNLANTSPPTYGTLPDLQAANLIRSQPTDLTVNTGTGVVTGAAPCSGYTTAG